MPTIEYAIRQIKYFSGAFALGVITIILGGLTHEAVAAALGMASHWVAFAYFATWLLACNRYNAHLNAEARAKREQRARREHFEA